MLKALLALLGSSVLLETAGAALIVYGIYEAAGAAGAVIAAGVALVLKAFEIDGRDT